MEYGLKMVKAKKGISNINPWMIWLPAAFFYCYQFMLRVSPSVMTEDLMREFSLDAAAFGSLTAFYYYSYSTLQIPLGILADYFGPRRLLTLAALLCASATVVFALSTNLHVAQLGRLLIGAGSSCAFLGAMKLGTLWFGPKKLPLIAGATMFLGTTGANFGGAPLRMLANSYDWRTSLLIVAGFGVLIAAGIWKFSKDEGLSHHKPVEKGSLLNGLKLALRTKQVWLGALYGFLLYTPLSAFADLWGTSFIISAYGISSVEASAYVNFIYIGLAGGALFFAWMVGNIMGMRSALILATIFVTLALGTVILIPNLPLWVTCSCLLITGFMIGGQTLCFPFTCSHMPVQYSGATIGFTNMSCMISGVLLQPLVGVVLDSFWTGEMDNGVRIFATDDYRLALTIIPICTFLAFLVSLLLKDAPEKKV